MSEKKKEKEGENSSKYKFKSICVFSEIEIGKSEEFLTTTNNLGNVLADNQLIKRLTLCMRKESRAWGKASQFLEVQK